MESQSELKFIFVNINDLLKFAETKHAGLIIFNAGLVISLLSSFSDIKIYVLKSGLLISIICFGISILVSILSQLPVMKNFFYNRTQIQNPNIYFYCHLAHFNKQDFIDQMIIINPSFIANRFDDDLINQILVNSRITQAKFILFKYSSYLTTFGLGLVTISTLIKVLCHL